jgi:hypothetical protein
VKKKKKKKRKKKEEECKSARLGLTTGGYYSCIQEGGISSKRLVVAQ